MTSENTRDPAFQLFSPCFLTARACPTRTTCICRCRQTRGPTLQFARRCLVAKGPTEQHIANQSYHSRPLFNTRPVAAIFERTRDQLSTYVVPPRGQLDICYKLLRFPRGDSQYERSYKLEIELACMKSGNEILKFVTLLCDVSRSSDVSPDDPVWKNLSY